MRTEPAGLAPHQLEQLVPREHLAGVAGEEHQELELEVTETPERLAQSAALLGVHPALSVPMADEIAFRLEIPRLVLRQAVNGYARARGRADRGRVLVGVLDQLGANACLLDCVLVTGARAGCWGTVTRWDVATWGARGRVFAGCGAPAG